MYSLRHIGQLGCETSAKDETLASEQTAVGHMGQICRHCLYAAAVVIAVQARVGHRYIFALASRRARRLREAAAAPWPQHIALAGHHTHHKGAYGLVLGKRNGSREVALAGKGIEAVATTKLGTTTLTQQPCQHAALHALGVSGGGYTGRGRAVAGKQRTCKRREIQHISFL